MKKILVLSALAMFAMACGGSDNKPAGDPSTTSSTTGTEPKASDPKAAPTSTTTPASTDAPKTGDAPKK
jgi:hypothetical protein